jgi:hypothetical protein
MGASGVEIALGASRIGIGVRNFVVAAFAACRDTWLVHFSRGNPMSEPSAAPVAAVAPQSSLISERCRAIIAGLIASGRARRVNEGQGHRLVDARGFVTLVKLAPGGGIYRVHRSGNTVLAGPDIVDTQPLQAGFLEAMIRIGTPRQGLEILASSPQSPLGRIAS